MNSTVSRFEQRCPECGQRDFVDDTVTGDLICKGCSMVLESHIIDERSEWRTFADSDKTGSDPNRVGAPVNPLLSGGGLSTVIGKVDGDGGQSFSLGRLNARTNQTDRLLVKSFTEIGAMCDKLALTEAIRERACEIYKNYKEELKSSLRGRKVIAFYAACIYISCRCELYPRTFKEINAAAPEASRKEIAKCFRLVINQMQDKNRKEGEAVEVGSIHPSDFMRRFGSRLGLGHEEVRACIQVGNAAMPKHGRDNGETKPWDGRSPISIAAGIIYLIVMTSKNRETTEKVTIHMISEVTQVSEGTIIPTYRELNADAVRVYEAGECSDEALCVCLASVVACMVCAWKEESTQDGFDAFRDYCPSWALQ